MKAFLLAVACVPLLIQAQNLIPNPGFETQTSCPLVSEITKAPPWNSPTLGTPDLFNKNCPQQNISARTGNGSSGIYLKNSFNNSREYIQVRLTAPLVAGHSYCLQFYVKRANFKYATNRIGAYFSDDSVYMQQTNPLPFTPDIENPAGTVIKSSTSWTKVSGSYTASGGESFIIIGNFYDDANTTLDSVTASNSVAAYYYIDDVALVDCATTGINSVADVKLNLYPNPAESFINIQAEEPISAVTILTMDGRTLLNNTAGQNTVTVGTFDLPDGMYVALIETANGVVSRRFAVSR